MPEWLMHWITPSGLLLLVGGIVWGVQLNVAVMNLTKKMAVQDRDIDAHWNMLHTMTSNQVRLTTVIERMEKDLDKIDQKLNGGPS